MLEKKAFWYFLMFGVIALWIAVIWLCFLLLPESGAWKFLLPGALLVLHLAELPISLKIGKSRGISPQLVVLNTVLFGFTWWLPLKRGVFD